MKGEVIEKNKWMSMAMQQPAGTTPQPAQFIQYNAIWILMYIISALVNMTMAITY